MTSLADGQTGNNARALALAGSTGGEKPEASASMRQLLKGPILFGLVVAGLFFVAGGLWAATAPLSSGAVASGQVSADGANPAIQHLEGGIVGAVYVREGQQVSAGDLLVSLISTRAEAGLSAQREEWLRLLVRRARLTALVDGADSIVVPPELEQYASAGMQEYWTSESKLFESQRTSYRQQISIYDRQIEQFNSEISALQAEIKGLEAQIGFIDLEIQDKQRLLDQQLIARSEVLTLQRQQASIAAAIASNQSQIARVNQSIEEVRLAKLQEYEAQLDAATREAADVNNSLAQIEQELVAATDQVSRTEVRSPVDGVVLNMRHERAGGVVAPGATIMDIVPLNDDMVILAKLNPQDIDSVSVGLKSHVTLVPFASRNELPLNGEVMQVGADSITDERTGQAYYEVRVRVPSEELAKHADMYMSPGMPADVTIVTGERTMLQYLVDPFVRSVRRAFVHD
ncbi:MULTISPECIES: HlyD family type I secretion periplasmic adaptor subunit [Devosia]|uniref:HlyD family type I secretion periplasmic adaptor subunit n=1 Tax=Devosia TaxID=46913 RepID=UPI000CE96486|nr:MULTISPECIES: HlyD family type I secretion periplasmic adaptor subunit [Devosia]AVF05059.1 hypothetical protein C4375_16010 [Devosia sp. I507]